MRVVDRIRRSGIAVAPDTAVGHVAEVMTGAGVGAVVVVDGARAVGIVTDRDVVRRVVARGLPTDARVDAIMTSPVVTIDGDSDVHDAYNLIRTQGVRRLIVTSGGRFTGVLSLDDLLVELASDLGCLSRTVDLELHHPTMDAGLPVPRSAVTVSNSVPS
jgi:CBS domain-containing protein